MRIVWVGMALGALLLAGCQTTPSGPAPQRVATASRPSMVCVTMEDTGSRLPQKECHTQAEWERIKGQGTDNLQLQAVPPQMNVGAH